MQGLYHKFAAIWSRHIRFLPHCFLSQKTSLVEPARLLTRFPSSKEEADRICDCSHLGARALVLTGLAKDAKN